MPNEIWFPRAVKEGAFLGNLNWDTRFEGRATPSFYAFEMTNSADVLHYFVDAIETIAPLGTSTGGQPRQYAGANKTMFRLDNGARSSDTTFNDVVQGMVLTDSFGAESITAGTKCLLVGFGSSTDPKNAIRNLTTDTSPWTVNTGGSDAQFWLIIKAGADLYAVTDAGVAVLGEWRVSKCPAGNDPTLAASWGNGLEVGGPEWGITGLAAIGDSVVVGKPDGLYYYNDQTKRFENVLPHLTYSPHAVNGKGLKSVTNGVLYPTHDGKLYFFDGVAVQEVTPLKGKTLPRDIGTSRITAIADNGDTVAVVTECWQHTTQGVRVVKVDGGTATELTSSVTDGSLSTGGSISSLGNTSTDYLYFGTEQPPEGFVVRMTRQVNSNTEAWDTPEYGTGTADTFTAFTAIVDGSILSTAGTSMVNTGFPPGASNAILTWTDPDAYSKCQVTTVNFGGSVGTITGLYWVRFPVGTTGFDASTEIDEVEYIPTRGGMPNSGVFTQANNFTHRDRAGGLCHVWLGKRERTVGFVWHDVYAVNNFGGVWAMAWHTGRLQFGNLGQSLALWGRYKQHMISESQTRDPSRTYFGSFAFYEASSPGPLLRLTPDGTYLGDASRLKRLKKIYVDTRYAHPTGDAFNIFIQTDERDIVLAAAWTGGPAVLDVSHLGTGRYFNAWLALNYLGQVTTPEIRWVEVEYEYEGDRFSSFLPIDNAFATPEKT